MKEKLSQGYGEYKEFARLRRRARAMQRQNLEQPQKMLERLVELDSWLTSNHPGWVSNFPVKK